MARTKTAFKLPGTGTSGRAKLITVLIVAALVWWIVTNPIGAAQTVTDVVNAVVTFCIALGD